jgi:DNA repair protein RecN (Recombination protein N)
MSGAKLSVSMTRKEMTQHGIDDVEFLLMSNPGEPPKPLRTIASGGELSRIMLVLKKILRDRSGVNVLVFDEVDTGISGGVARAVGQKLKSLSKDSQVICITHLPQVASYADHHLLVEKSGTKKVSTSVRELAQKGERIEEIARMLSGFEVTESSKKSAEELIATAI